jgi:hypothetical protein
MAMNEQWIWFLMGFLPFYLAWGYIPGGRWMFEVRALYWRLRIERWPGIRGGRVLQLPLIEQLKGMVWAVVLQLSKYVPES